MARSGRRLALYWHAGHSLGHTVRNGVLAAAFQAAEPRTAVVGLTRSRHGLDYLPDAVDVVKLPELEGRQPPELMTRRVRGAVSELPAERVARMRQSLVDGFVSTFEPDAFVVDYHPLGMARELEDAIRSQRGCRWVLGLRGILQSRERTALSHFGPAAAAEIAELYSAIWVYADRRLIDLAEIYEIEPTLAGMLSYTGYVTRAAGVSAPPAAAAALERPLVVVSFGGGKQMDRLLEAAVAAALERSRGTVAVLAGPWADARQLAALERRCGSDRLRVVLGSRELHAWLRVADLFIGKGGYNTLAEILATGANAIVVRGGTATVEQSWHAERLAAAGFVRSLDAGELESAGGRAVARALADPYPQAGWSPAVDGAAECARMLQTMLSEPIRP